MDEFVYGMAFCGLASLFVGGLAVCTYLLDIFEKYRLKASRRRAVGRGVRASVKLGWNVGEPPIGVPLLVRHDCVKGGIDVMTAFESAEDSHFGRRVWFSGTSSQWRVNVDDAHGWIKLSEIIAEGVQ